MLPTWYELQSASNTQLEARRHEAELHRLARSAAGNTRNEGPPPMAHFGWMWQLLNQLTHVVHRPHLGRTEA